MSFFGTVSLMSSLRHLVIDLDRATSAPVGSWQAPAPDLAPLAAWGGVAAGLAGMARGEDGLQLAVGPAVRRGVATAARATVLGRSPLTGRPSEGQVGSDLGRRLARVADLVTLRGRAEGEGAVLLVDEDGARVERCADLVGRAPEEVHAGLVERFGPLASLRVGPAGTAGVTWANLAAGAEPQSFVGRGGLGARLASHGLLAVAITAAPVEASGSDDLERVLLASPRLRARAQGGTFELAGARTASGDLAPEVGRELEAGVSARRSGRHGCDGCPTPCGWTFERGEGDGASGASQGARFSAVHALGAQLGLGADDALALLGACNRLGLDAKEASAALTVAVSAGDVAAADRGAQLQLLERIARGELLGEGAAVHARLHGLPDPTAGGEALRPESDPAVRLAALVAVRGAEPMRTSGGLLVGRVGEPLGRQVWWHENLAAALDATGFCAFAAAGVLADGVLGLDGLAAALEPGLDGGALLDRGATLVALVAEAAQRMGAPRRPPEEGDLLEAEAWPAYRALRFLDEEGGLLPEGSAGALLARGASPEPAGVTPPEPQVHPVPEGVGRVALGAGGAGGALGRALGADVELPLPATVRQVLEAAASRWPDAAPLLLDGPRPLPTVYRAGRLLGPDEVVHPGERLELVLAVSGG